MSKLNPPIIEGTIPAFTSGDGIKIPIIDNQTVNPEGKGYEVKIKTLVTEQEIATIRDGIERNENYIKFAYKFPTDKGEYFKFQVAYIDKEEIGYFSNVGIGKFLKKEPEIILEETQSKDGYVGTYTSSIEKPYSYCFTVKNLDGSIYETSGELLHNFNSQDDGSNYTYIDSYKQQKELETGVTYKIEYTVTTINGYTTPVESIFITKERTISSVLQKGHLIATNNYDEGYIDLTYTRDDSSLVTGNFTIVRSSEKDDFKEWRLIYSFALSAESVKNRHLYKDFTVEQGVEYCYAIQQKNSSNLYSEKLKNDYNVVADFEDMFLFDGKRQLKIKFNPKISSFKKTLMENKSDTIGSKYPFFFRNGQVEYKEFPINGLISYLTDENDLFTSTEEKLNKGNNYIIRERTTNLTSDNFLYERNFKMEVLDWLTDGKPKLFRSAAEGNYLVRLMDVSLSPTDTLGRMLHSFSATAYEIGGTDYDSLVENNIIPDVHLIEENNKDFGKSIFFKTVKLWEDKDYIDSNSIKLKSSIVQNVKFVDMEPQTKIYINGQSFIIGVSRSLTLPAQQEVTNISFDTKPTSGLLYYSYLGTLFNIFEAIKGTSIEYVIDRQFKGSNNNVLKAIADIKTDITQIFRIQAQIYNDFSAQTEDTNIINESDQTENTIDMTNKIGITYKNSNIETIIDISAIGNYIAYNLENVSCIKTGPNILLDITYATAIKEYSFEDEDAYLVILAGELAAAKRTFISEKTENNANAYNRKYEEYIDEVEKVLKEKQAETLNLTSEVISNV